MTDLLYKTLIQSLYLYKGLFRWLNWPGYISGTIVQPFAQVTMFALLGAFSQNVEAGTYYAIGVTVLSMAFIIVNGITQSYHYDRAYGTITFMFMSPANRLINFLARTLFHFPNGIITGIIGLFAGWYIIGIDFSNSNWSQIYISLIVISISLLSVGQLLGIFSIISGNWVAVQGIALGLILMLTGIIIPVSSLPKWLQWVVAILPVTNGLEALRHSFAGYPLSIIIFDLFKELIIGVIVFAGAYLGFVLFEEIIKKRGTIDNDAN